MQFGMEEEMVEWQQEENGISGGASSMRLARWSSSALVWTPLSFSKKLARAVARVPDRHSDIFSMLDNTVSLVN